MPYLPFAEARTARVKANTERVAYAGVLVGGGAIAGLTYEVVGRPFDNARHLARAEQLAPHTPHRTLVQLLATKLRHEGPLSFLKDPLAQPVPPGYVPRWQQRLYSASRALARVGPWGVGFLAFEYWSPSVN